ncbi:MAG: sulfite exporter TauE/SafE family protein [Planctomycetota bacterium]
MISKRPIQRRHDSRSTPRSPAPMPEFLALFLGLPQTLRVRWPAWTAPPVGLLSGFLGGLFGTGGPPLIVYYQLSGAEKAAFRGNLMAAFLVVTIVKVPTYALTGLLTLPRLQAGLAVFPAVLLGFWLGNRVHVRLSETTFRRLVSGLLALIGVGLLAGI